jgi:hypothetical protein
MHHQPEPILLVRLQLKEMVSAAKSRKLDLAFLSAHRLQAGMTQRLVYQFSWLRENSVSVASSRRYCSPKFLQQLSCNLRILECCSLCVGSNSYLRHHADRSHAGDQSGHRKHHYLDTGDHYLRLGCDVLLHQRCWHDRVNTILHQRDQVHYQCQLHGHGLFSR